MRSVAVTVFTCRLPVPRSCLAFSSTCRPIPFVPTKSPKVEKAGRPISLHRRPPEISPHLEVGLVGAVFVTSKQALDKFPRGPAGHVTTAWQALASIIPCRHCPKRRVSNTPSKLTGRQAGGTEYMTGDEFNLPHYITWSVLGRLVGGEICRHDVRARTD